MREPLSSPFFIKPNRDQSTQDNGDVQWGTLTYCHFILATSKPDTAPPLWLCDGNPHRDLLSIVREHPLIKLITDSETYFSQLFDKPLFIYGESHLNCQIHNPQGPHRIYTH